MPVLQRARLLQKVTSMLPDGLGAALLRRSDDSDRGTTLRAAVERIRVGAGSDSAGNIRALPR